MRGGYINEETQRILQMLEEGKINAAEAGRLLDALGSTTPAADEGDAGRAARGKTLHVRVYNRGSDKPKVTVNIPVGLAQWAMRFIPREVRAEMQEKDIDAAEVLEQLRANPGEVAVIEDDEENQRIEVYIK